MDKTDIYLGDNKLNRFEPEVEGHFVEIQNEKYYVISNYHFIPDFFMTIVSDSDHWMFLSSNGALTAGRKDRDNGLFPYTTVDKIHDSKNITGSRSYLFIEKNGKISLWEPFTDVSAKTYQITRNLYKSIYGNKVIFEEVNLDLGIKFQYGWYNSEEFGFIKKSKVTNLTDEPINIEVLDGIKNILPFGIDNEFQTAYSNLLDAYKKSELLENSQLGIFSLSSIPVDRPEPSESLKATTVWSCGQKQGAKILLSEKQVGKFTKGLTIENETDVRAHRGAYFLNFISTLSIKGHQEWMIIAEINQDSTAVADLDHLILSEIDLSGRIEDNISKGTQNLVRIVSSADGLQMGNEDLGTARHFSNTLFNLMRGGVFTNNYLIDNKDFKLFVAQTNKIVFNESKLWLDEFPTNINYEELLQKAYGTNNPDLIRIVYEYLPLTFSRRHGDPSRPWNRFSIDTKNEDGSPKLNYEGNWRDIFQNWEALGLSFPEFIEGMITKFVNASITDGYNPYRITRNGIDWECPNPDDPWAYIGYWGDHQIIYLLKLLELSNEFHPGTLETLLSKELFAYANVPYRIKPYDEIVNNPKETMLFDKALNEKIIKQVEQFGADGRLLQDKNKRIYKVNLTEKILVTLLAKLSNFIPEAGIWLNTQRPEWNDANNALVGNGTSMVTLYYIRRFLKFWTDKFEETPTSGFKVSEEVKTLFDQIFRFFAENKKILETGFSDNERRLFADYLGNAGSNYRNGICEKSFCGIKKEITAIELKSFAVLCIQYMDQSIKANSREDGLYHSYNLISFSDESVSVRHLYEMLEGQVAVLSSTYLSVNESLTVLDSLKASKLFRPDQYSYILYPDRQLPLFIEKNSIQLQKLKASKLLQKLIEDDNEKIVSLDKNGNCHFNGTFRNSAVLSSAIDQLNSGSYAQLVESGKQEVLDIYEEMFDHKSFTGRSGTFYGYEGLGSIYWHMVSKLLLATQECYFRGVKEEVDPAITGKIKDHYYEIKAGIGLYKSPSLYGAFPTDPYSHTPAHAGAQQPGMTGQVKEDFIARMKELGLHIIDGQIVFNTSLMNPYEQIIQDKIFEYYDLKGKRQQISLTAGQLAFTCCQVPVVYTFWDNEQLWVSFKNGQRRSFKNKVIDKQTSALIFGRTDEITRIDLVIKFK
jgi:hypothetical protein